VRFDETYLRPLPAGTAPMVSRSAVERTAREAFGRPRTGKVSTFALLATDNELEKRQPDGTWRRQILNRLVGVVLYPKTRVQGFRENFVAFIDGRTGKFLHGMSE